MKLIPHGLTAALWSIGIRSLSGFGRPRRPPHRNSSSTPCCLSRGCSKKHFEENQLSPSLIGLSPLATAHPGSFQPAAVRASTRSYPSFTLAMARSLGFGSNPANLVALFRLAFAAPTPIGLSLLVRLSRWPIIQKVRGHPGRTLGSDCL